MDGKSSERVVAFERHMSVNWGELARAEIASGKRWNLLQAVAYLASGDPKLVERVCEWCPHYNALPHPNAAQAAFIHLSKALDDQRANDEQCFSIDAGTRALFSGLKDGAVTAYVDAKAAHLTGLEFRELACKSDMIGLAPTPHGDARSWGSVYVSAEDILRLRGQTVASTPGPETSAPAKGAKRGRKALWDWPEMMGELVRIADQDGLDSIGTQADVERWAIAWHADRTGSDGPGVSVVREHIAPVFQAIERENHRRRGNK